MKVSCVIVSYNNGALVGNAIMSVIQQTHPVDEIIVADDASTDGSPELISALVREHPTVRPIFRQQNVGVSKNRDLAIGEATGDFVTTLDGDDFFYPRKIEAEVDCLQRSSADIAYSDLRIINVAAGSSSVQQIADFASLSRRERVRWLLTHGTHNPREPLFRREIHDRIGGYNPRLRTYEDWDYKIRLAADDSRWVHSGVVGVAIRRHGRGLSASPPWRHMVDRLRVIWINQRLLRANVSTLLACRVATKVVLTGVKWSTLSWYRRVRRRQSRLAHDRHRS